MAVCHECAEWRILQSHPRYEISCCGVVRRLFQSGRFLNKYPAGSIVVPGVWRSPYIRADGSVKHVKYLAVMLADEYGKNYKPKRCQVSRLVCEAFHGPPPTQEHQAAHNDGNTINNNYKNLRWATPKENSNDIEIHGTRAFGDKIPHSKLSEAQVTEIINLIMAGMTDVDIALHYGVRKGCILEIRRLKSWRRVPKPPGFEALFDKPAPKGSKAAVEKWDARRRAARARAERRPS